MATRGVFFDYCGTLTAYGDMKEAWADWFEALYLGFSHSCAGVSRDDLQEHCEGFFSRPAPPAGKDEMSIFERRIDALSGDMGLVFDRTHTAAIADALLDAWGAHLSLDPEALDVLEKLSACHTLALVSNFEHPPYIRSQLQKYGLGGLFAAVVISGEVGVAKPDPRIFSIALDETGLSAEDVVHVGDTKKDAQGSLAAGMRCVIIRREGIGENGGKIATDYRAKADTAEDPEDGAPFRGARVISRLPELFDIVF